VPVKSKAGHVPLALARKPAKSDIFSQLGSSKGRAGPVKSSRMSDANRNESEAEQEARDRRAANIFLLVAAVVVIGAGIWLLDALLAARKADQCIAAGRTNCSPVETPIQR
jgi:hypothetical protein